MSDNPNDGFQQVNVDAGKRISEEVAVAKRTRASARIARTVDHELRHMSLPQLIYRWWQCRRKT